MAEAVRQAAGGRERAAEAAEAKMNEFLRELGYDA